MSALTQTSERAPRSLRPLLAAVVGSLAALLATLAGAGVASAHTSFDSSTPADGAVLDGPVDEVVIEFTNPASEAGDGFVVLDADGQIRTPTSVVVDEGRVFRLAFDPPLAGGQVGVRWSVRAGDAHPIEGSFSFTAGGEGTAAPPSTDTPVSSPAVGAPTTGSGTTPEGAGTATDGPSMTAAEMAAMDEFLRVDTSSPGEGLARAGRLIGFPAIVLAIGALAFAATTLRGSRGEIGGLVTGVRILGIVLVVGAVAEYVGVARITDESLGSAWSASAGLATLLRAVAGVLLAIGLHATSVALRPRARALSAATREAVLGAGDAVVDPEGPLRRWRPDRRSALAFAGIALAVASFWFDGHTVTKGIRVLHALANSVHVVAGSIWAGGVVTLAIVLWARHRAGRPADALGLVVRFSSLAAVALGAVVVAGVLMAVAILDSFDELTSTQWGQTLLLKTAAAAVAMAIGAYNHFRLMPALDRDPDDEQVHRAVRSSVTAEAIILGFVVVATVWLVAAAI